MITEQTTVVSFDFIVNGPETTTEDSEELDTLLREFDVCYAIEETTGERILLHGRDRLASVQKSKRSKTINVVNCLYVSGRDDLAAACGQLSILRCIGPCDYMIDFRQEQREHWATHPEEQFAFDWRRFAEAGQCDAVGCEEYQRVLKRWLSAARPENVRKFIRQHTKLKPPIPSRWVKRNLQAVNQALEAIDQQIGQFVPMG